LAWGSCDPVFACWSIKHYNFVAPILIKIASPFLSPAQPNSRGSSGD
jgi:hypothetical protein